MTVLFFLQLLCSTVEVECLYKDLKTIHNASPLNGAYWQHSQVTVFISHNLNLIKGGCALLSLFVILMIDSFRADRV